MKTLLLWTPFNYPAAPPLGIAYLSAHLKKKGYDVDVLDLNVKLYNKFKSYYRHLPTKLKGFKDGWGYSATQFKAVSALLFPEVFSKSFSLPMWDPLSSYLLIKEYFNSVLNEVRDEYEVFGFSVTNVGLLSSLFLSRSIKAYNKDAKIVWGGPVVTPETGSQLILTFPFLDLLVYGEGESVLEKILERFHEGRSAGGLCGTISKNDEGVLTGDLQEIVHPDYRQYPDYSGFHLADYENLTLSLLSSSGCAWNRCAFCSEGLRENRFHHRKGKNVAAEFHDLSKRYKPTSIQFVDNCANGDIPHLEEMCDLLSNGFGKQPWRCMIRSKNITRDLLGKMKMAGCYSVFIGLESFSDPVLERMRKGCNKLHHLRLFKFAREQGISVEANFMIFFPSETVDDIKETLNVLQQYAYLWRNCRFWLSSFSAELNCEVFNDPGKFGVELVKWTDSSEYFPSVIESRMIFWNYYWRHLDQQDDKTLEMCRRYLDLQQFIQAFQLDSIPRKYYYEQDADIIICTETPRSRRTSKILLRDTQRDIFIGCDDISTLSDLKEKTNLDEHRLRHSLALMEEEGWVAQSGEHYLNTIPRLSK
jgi:radical SAM superfamily enzyme YgiQ (UPF0313 family)